VNKQKYIYVLLTYPPTLIARVIGLYTRKSYTHASLALDPELKQLYSFGRKVLYFPLIGGFIHENPKAGVFKVSRDISCKVYKIPVTGDQFERIRSQIQEFLSDPNRYGYNFFGLLGIILNRRIPIKDHYFCSEFVAKVLSDGGITLFDKDSALVRPDDFLDVEAMEEVYTGVLNHYVTQSQT
jgi:hypothetical protein